MTSRNIVVEIPEPRGEIRSAPLTPSFDYTRSTGPVLGRFFTGLRDGIVYGARDSRGVVHVPPVEFDPHTREAITDDAFVEVGTTGEVTTWTWVREPVAVHRLGRPFAWALVRLDGADTTMLLPVDCGAVENISTGMRVRLRWAEEREGSIRDIECAVPVSGPAATDDDNAGNEPTTTSGSSDEGREPVTGIVTPITLSVLHSASPSESAFLDAIVEGRLLGRRRSNGDEVYVPPREYTPSDGVRAGEYVEVSDHGTVTTFGIVNVPFLGQKVKPPYVTAYILLDGADVPVQHLVLGCEASEVRMGMRVRAVWHPEEGRPASMLAISHFEPSGEPDAAVETYERHL